MRTVSAPIRLCILLAAMAAARAVAQDAESALVAKAREIHERVLIFDAHIDIPFDFATADVDPGMRAERQVDLPKMAEGGMDAAFFNVYVAQEARNAATYAKAHADALIKFKAIHRMTTTMYPEQIGLATSPADVRSLQKERKRIAAIGIENGFIVGRDVALVAEYFELGARYMGLTHGGHNDLADSATPLARFDDSEAEHGGLSALGKRVIAEMNRVGMIVDISHMSRAATLQTLRLSKAPVMASHSGVQGVADLVRNLSDEELYALKENGGVMHAIALAAFVKLDPPEKRDAIRNLADAVGVRYISGSVGPAALAELSEARRNEYDTKRARIDAKWPRASITDFVDHIDYAVNLIGIDHVGIGSDFDGGGGLDGWDDASESFNITLELVRRGYSEEHIAKIWGGNLLRVWEDVERVARRMAP